MQDSIEQGEFAILDKRTAKQAYDLNIAIEKLIAERGTNPNNYSADVKRYIMQYSGMGGLQAQGAKGKGLLYEYFTPDMVVQKMWELCLQHGFDGGNVLEPAAGVGVYLKNAPKTSTPIAFTTYEINKISHSILKICYPSATNYNAYFEQRFISDKNTSVKKNVEQKFDLVIGNPPYGSVKGDSGGYYFNLGEDTYSEALSYDEYFILRGLDTLKSGGILSYIIGAEVANGGIPFLQKGTTKTKSKISEIGELIDAYRLPNGVFERTDVLSDIVIFKKY